MKDEWSQFFFDVAVAMDSIRESGRQGTAHIGERTYASTMSTSWKASHATPQCSAVDRGSVGGERTIMGGARLSGVGARTKLLLQSALYQAVGLPMMFVASRDARLINGQA